MTNVEMLRDAINDTGLPRVAIAAAWGMSMPTFYSRISGKSEFTAPEIIAATEILHLSKRQRDQIFFGD